MQPESGPIRSHLVPEFDTVLLLFLQEQRKRHGKDLLTAYTTLVGLNHLTCGHYQPGPRCTGLLLGYRRWDYLSLSSMYLPFAVTGPKADLLLEFFNDPFRSKEHTLNYHSYAKAIEECISYALNDFLIEYVHALNVITAGVDGFVS